MDSSGATRPIGTGRGLIGRERSGLDIDPWYRIATDPLVDSAGLPSGLLGRWITCSLVRLRSALLRARFSGAGRPAPIYKDIWGTRPQNWRDRPFLRIRSACHQENPRS